MRKYSIDELPQFINVLSRDMSVVGPRPPLAREVQAYDDHAMKRLLVRPGITGLWQVTVRSEGGVEEQEAHDTYYIRNWSVWLDVYILSRTVAAVLSGRGAY